MRIYAESVLKRKKFLLHQKLELEKLKIRFAFFLCQTASLRELNVENTLCENAFRKKASRSTNTSE